jgi:peptidoglycan hydrolase-like protein with peptidoglycan-binding domain
MPGTLNRWPVVAIGLNGHPVKTLQYLLRARGHNLAVDGGFGAQTDAAVKAFQTSKGLTANGTVNAQTWSALIVHVQNGSHGDAVRGVQEEFQFLNESGNPSQGVQVDSDFGSQTDAAVRAFQHALSLDIPTMAVDGVVGPMTWQGLVSGMLSG